MSVCNEQDHYVCVIERDLPVGRDDERVCGPLVWEHYVGPQTSLDEIKEHARELTRYGQVKIAKLQFIDGDPVATINRDRLVALNNEIDCLIQHGAEGAEHLRYVHTNIKELLQ